MRTRDHGATYSVDVSEHEVQEFDRRWPGSKLEGRQRFEFAKRNGDLVGRDGIGDGPEAVALARDAQAFGQTRRE